MYHLVGWIYILLDGLVCSIEEIFTSHAVFLLLIGQKWKLVKLAYSVNQFVQVFVGAFKHLLEKQRWNDK